MAWWSLGRKNKFDKKPEKKHYSASTVAAHIKQKNEVVSEYSQAMDRLKGSGLSLEERYRNLVLTYRDGRDLMVVPEAWMGRDLIVNCTCKKIYVETPVPSIVRTR